MARPKNTEGRRVVRNAAFDLFKTKGFAATTYRDIAEAVGKERTVVQGFFPKKVLYIEQFFNALAHGAQDFAEQNDLLGEDVAYNLSIIGQLYFGFLIHDRSMCNFTKGVLAEREGTVRSLLFNEEWVSTFFDVDEADYEGCMDSFVAAMGGGYELLYKNLMDGKPTNVPGLVRIVVQSYVATSGLFDDAVRFSYRELEPAKMQAAWQFLEERIYA